jgi:uncharacterized damage-inducible protein DinB
METQQIATQQAEVAALFVKFSTAKLNEMTRNIADCLARLSDEQIWRRGGPHENAIGNLILHLCGNMRQWILHGIGGQPDVRVRDLEFSATDGYTGPELLARFQATVAEASSVISATSAARLLERTTPQGRDVTVLDAVYQVVGHVQQHTGQIILLTKQMAGQDLDLTLPRPR